MLVFVGDVDGEAVGVDALHEGGEGAEVLELLGAREVVEDGVAVHRGVVHAQAFLLQEEGHRFKLCRVCCIMQWCPTLEKKK